jgi:rhodanese-related sulfurtransferase
MQYKYLFLCLIAILLSCKSTDDKNQLTEQQLLLEIDDERRYLSPEDLADLIINDDPTLRLIDVRDVEEYNKFFLPGALHLPLDDFESAMEKLRTDCEHYTTVFYSNNGTIADKGWLLYRISGCQNGYVLNGGLKNWVESILQPIKPEASASSDIQELYQYRVAARNYFAGLSKELTPQPFVSAQPRQPVAKAKKKKVVSEEEGC